MSQRSNQQVNLGEDGLPEVPELESVEIKTDCSGRLVVPPGAGMYMIDQITNLKGVAVTLHGQLIEKNGECDDLRSDLETRDEELAAAQAMSVEGAEWALKATNGQGKIIPKPQMYIWATFPNGVNAVVSGTLPQNVGDSMCFGTPAIGYRVTIELVTKRILMSDKPKLGYMYTVANWGNTCYWGEDFIDADVFESMYLRATNRRPVGGGHLPASFRMCAFGTLPDAITWMVAGQMKAAQARGKTEAAMPQLQASAATNEESKALAAAAPPAKPASVQQLADPPAKAGPSKPPAPPLEAFVQEAKETAPHKKANGAAGPAPADPPTVTLEGATTS